LTDTMPNNFGAHLHFQVSRTMTVESIVYRARKHALMNITWRR